MKWSLNIKLKKPIKQIYKKFEDLGFTSLEIRKNKIIAEKIEARDIKDNASLYYKIKISKNKLEFEYTYTSDKLRRETEMLATLLNIIKVLNKEITVDINPLFDKILEIINEIKDIFDSEEYENIYKLKELKINYDSLKEKYKELLLSNEENAKMLLECEKKRDQYYERIKKLEGISDRRLRKEVYKWIKEHNGEIDIDEFIKHYKVSYARVEETLNYLLKNRYIKRK